MVYVDHNASTALDSRVLEAMRPYLESHHANASALYREGRLARAAIDQAREQVAELVGAHPAQVVFTSGGTEANNLALKGAVNGMGLRRIALSGLEHSSILQAAAALKRRGCQVDEMPVHADGRLDVEQAAGALKPGVWAALMWANNETGVIQDVPAFARAARTQGAYVHCDAVQAAGKLPIDFNASGVHVLTLSAHKIHGPKGVGATILDRALDIEPLIHGGGHEQGLRAGTENVAGIVGFGMAAQLALRERETRATHCQGLLAQFESLLVAAIPDAVVFGQAAPRLSNTSFFSVPGIHGETLLTALDEFGYAVGSGSACESKSGKPSHVLTAMGVDPVLAEGAVRVSFGHGNSVADVAGLARALVDVIARFRAMTAVRSA